MTKLCEQVSIKYQQIGFLPSPPRNLPFCRNTTLSTVGCFHSILSCLKISCKRICCRSQTKCCYAFNTFKGIRRCGYVLLRSSSNNGKSGKTLKVQVPGSLKDVTMAGKMLEDFFLELCAPHPQGMEPEGGWSRSCVLLHLPLFPTPSVLLQQHQMTPTSPDVQCCSPLCFCVYRSHRESSLLSSKAQLQHHLFYEAQAVNYSHLWSFFFVVLFHAGELLKSKKLP